MKIYFKKKKIVKIVATQICNQSKNQKLMNLHGEENLVVPLELNENRDKIGLEQARGGRESLDELER